MSFKLVDQVIATHVGDANAKLMLLLIARHAHNDGSGCIAGIGTLAAEAEFSDKTARRAMDFLDDAGFTRHRRRVRALGYRTSDETLLAVDPAGRICRWSDLADPAAESKPSGQVDRLDSESKRSSCPGLTVKLSGPSGQVDQAEVKQSENLSGKRSERGARRPAKPEPRREPKRPRALSLNAALEEDSELQPRCLREAAAVRSDMTPEQVTTDFANFHDHYVSMEGVTRADWSAAWRKWHRSTNLPKLTQSERRAQVAAQIFGTADANRPAHPSHHYFDSTATRVDDADPFAIGAQSSATEPEPPPEPPELAEIAPPRDPPRDDAPADLRGTVAHLTPINGSASVADPPSPPADAFTRAFPPFDAL